LPKKSIFFNLINTNRKISYVSRSAGTYCTLLDFEMGREFARIKVPSGLILMVYSLNFVTLGRNSNIFVKKLVIGKAGLSRILGFRSSVRGVAKNPVDHPHGGRTKTNSPECTP
jgi:large subunit ribosomal protein L2